MKIIDSPFFGLIAALVTVIVIVSMIFEGLRLSDIQQTKQVCLRSYTPDQCKVIQ